MIISASRRTDIPAFFSNWFMNRVREGYFYSVNPFNSNQITKVSLESPDVDAICFWTKNPRPLIKHLIELENLGLNYYFQFTLNPYGKEFEPGLPSLEKRIATFRALSGQIGQERVVWRYDPVILSNATPVEWHLERADFIASSLSGRTDRLVFSFCDFYGKGRGRLRSSLKNTGIILEDITDSLHEKEMVKLVKGFRAVADRYELSIFSCCEDIGLEKFGVTTGACIDPILIQKLFNRQISSRKDKNQRKACKCAGSVDMGAYNSCGYRCRYCYANFNDRMIDVNVLKHHPDAPCIIPHYKV